MFLQLAREIGIVRMQVPLAGRFKVEGRWPLAEVKKQDVKRSFETLRLCVAAYYLHMSRWCSGSRQDKILTVLVVHCLYTLNAYNSSS